MNSIVVSASRDQLLDLRKAVLKTRESKERFEESPADFLTDSTDLDLSHCTSLISALCETPKGLRCLTLDYAISLRLRDYAITSEGEAEPSPQGPVPIPLVGVNVLAVYNAVVIGNVAAYHQVGAGVAVAAAAVAVKVATYTGSGSIDVIGDRAVPLPDCHFDERYLMGSLHRKLLNCGFGEARERLYIRKIIAENLEQSETDYTPNVPIKVSNGSAEVTFCLSDTGSLLVLDGSEIESL